MHQSIRRITTCVAVLMVFMALAAPVRGGSGVVTNMGNGFVVDLTVFFDDPTQDQAKWIANFTQTHRMMWLATRGMLRLGKIRIGYDLSAKGRADIRIDKAGHASVSQPSDRERTSLGTEDTLYLFEEDRDSPIVSMHELGHYLFCLSDEYVCNVWSLVNGVETVVERGNEELSFCSVERASPPLSTVNPNHSCLMYDNSYPTIYYLFCAEEHLKRNNLADGRWAVTKQQEHNGKSCAATVAAFFRLGALPAPRTDDPPDQPTFVLLKPEVRLGVFLQHNLSASELQKAQKEAVAAVRRLRLPSSPRGGDSVGVATFGTTVQNLVPWNALQTQADIDGAATAISGVTPGSGPVDLEAALRAQMASIAGGGYDYATKTILLCTNGAGTVSQALIDDLRRNDVVVTVLAVADNPGTRALKALAVQTGGDWALAGTAAEKGKRGSGIPLAADDEYSEGAELSGEYVIARYAGTLQPGTPRSHTLPVDSLTEDFTLVFTSQAGGPLSLTLRDPSGTAVDLVDPPSGVWVQQTATEIQVQVEFPDSGDWTAQVDGTSAATYTGELSGSGAPLGEMDLNETLNYPAVPLIRVRVENGLAISGCQVQAVVTSPGTAPTAFLLHDDGDLSFHGDERADDGVYCAYYTSFPSSGTYQVEVRIENQTGQYTTAFDGIDRPLGSPPPGPVGPAPVFHRLLFESFVEEGVPAGGGVGLLPPGNLILRSPGPGRVTLDWTDPSGGQARTLVQRSAGSPGNFQDIALLDPGPVSFTDTLNGEQGQIFYRLVARTPAGDSRPSGVGSIAPALMGDLDTDSLINAADLDILMNTVAGNIARGSSPCLRPDCGDWNGDGLLNATDVAIMARKMAGSQ